MRFMTESREAMTWTLKSERPEAAGYLTVRCRTYLQPDGKESDWDILQGSPTVALVAFTEEGRGILVRQYRPAPARCWRNCPAA